MIFFILFSGKDASERSSTLERALGFFQENNENYKVSWAEANEKIALGEVKSFAEIMFRFKKIYYFNNNATSHKE